MDKLQFLVLIIVISYHKTMEMPFETDLCWPKEPRIRGGAHWPHLANTTE